MSFLSPLFLLGGLAAVVPIVLHLLKRDPDVRLRFSAVRLLRSAPVEHAHKRHLRELLLLALRVTALLLLAFAFARPFFTGATAGSAAVTVVVLDTSASMSAPGQFEKARALAKRAIDSAAGGLVAVVTFDDVPQVVSRPSSDRALASAAIDAARAGVGSTRYRPALELAADLLEGRDGTIVVVSDLQTSGWDAGDRAAMPESARLEVADVGGPPPNLAVTAARGTAGRVVVTIRNAGPDVREATVALNAGDNERGDSPARVAETRVPIGANASAEVTFAAPRQRWASVVVEDAGGVAADNVRYLVLGEASRPRVLVVMASGDVSREAFYVEQALIASGAAGASGIPAASGLATYGRGYEVVGVAGSGLQTWDQARVDEHAAIVLISTRGLEHHARALLATYARNGGGILVAAAADVDADVLSEALGGARIGLSPPGANQGAEGVSRTLAPSDARHPALRAFQGRASLGLVRFRKWTTVRGTPADGCQPLARFTSGHAALVDCEIGKGRALIFASDLDNRWNDFPRHSTFLPFLHEAVGYLSRAARSSDYTVGHVPAGVDSTPGITLKARSGQEAARLIAVNVDPAESDPERMTPDEFRASIATVTSTSGIEPRGQARENENSQAIWRYLLMFMAVVLIAESAVATRIA